MICDFQFNALNMVISKNVQDFQFLGDFYCFIEHFF